LRRESEGGRPYETPFFGNLAFTFWVAKRGDIFFLGKGNEARESGEDRVGGLGNLDLRIGGAELLNQNPP